jgi:hypothetical protein
MRYDYMIDVIPQSKNLGIGSPLSCSTEILWHKKAVRLVLRNTDLYVIRYTLYAIRYTLYAIRLYVTQYMTYNIRYTLYVIQLWDI